MVSQVSILVYSCISLVVINEEEERGMRGLHVKHVNHTTYITGGDIPLKRTLFKSVLSLCLPFSLCQAYLWGQL
jgi:hypothetical protein